jgi:hypothetical protein
MIRKPNALVSRATPRSPIANSSSSSASGLQVATAVLAMNNGLIIDGICDGTPFNDSANLWMSLLDNLAPSVQP